MVWPKIKAPFSHYPHFRGVMRIVIGIVGLWGLVYLFFYWQEVGAVGTEHPSARLHLEAP